MIIVIGASECDRLKHGQSSFAACRCELRVPPLLRRAQIVAFKLLAGNSLVRCGRPTFRKLAPNWPQYFKMSHSSSNSVASSCPPKGFLKKGEGLKRFAAYKPPPPVAASKLGRRQTFVKFKPQPEPLSLADESLEVPKIGPPKIIHTPIRPNRQALNAINDVAEEPPRRYNLRGSRKQCPDQKKEPRRTKRQIAPTDLTSPTPGNCLLALGQQIQEIQLSVDELRDRMKNCRCGALGEAPSRAEKPKILDRLVDDVSKLKARLDELKLRL